jgi:hypothetical protein
MRRLRAYQSCRHALCVLAGFTLFYIAFFGPVLWRGELLAPGDARNLSLAHFGSPRTLWTPDLFSGFPAMADPQNQMWYPPACLFSALDCWNGFVISAFVLASSFTYGYVHALTRSKLASVISGCVFGLSGFMITHLGHTNIIHSVAWMPLLLWSFESLYRTWSPGWMTVGALAMGLCLLGGHPQFAFYAAMLGGLYVLCSCPGAPAGRLVFVASCLGATLLGIGLAAILVLPMAQLEQQSLRASLTFDDFCSYCLPLRQWPRQFFPYLYGGMWDPGTHSLSRFVGGGGGIGEATGFVGLSSLVLAGIAVVRSPARRVVRFWSAIAFVAFLVALGKETPLTAILFRVPIYNRFRIPTRHFAEFSLAVSVLAGLGLVALGRLNPIVRWHTLSRAFLAMSLAMLLGFSFFAIAYQRGTLTRGLPAAGGPLPPVLGPALWIPFAVLAITAGATWLWACRPGPASLTLLVAAVLLDLASFSWPAEWNYGSLSSIVLDFPVRLRPYRDQLAASHQRLAPLVADSAMAESAPSNRTRLWHLSSVIGYAPLALARYSQFLGSHYVGYSDYHCLAGNDRGLDLLAARYLLVPRSWFRGQAPAAAHGFLAALNDQKRWRHVEDFTETSVYDNRSALPRAWLAATVMKLDAPAILRAIHESSLPGGQRFEPHRIALVEEDPPHLSGAIDPEATVRVQSATTSEIDVEVQSRQPAFLVLSDIYYPGWQATVAGQAAEIYRTDYVLRGVRVPAGQSLVRFQFRPSTFFWGIAVTSLALLAVVSLLVAQLLCKRDVSGGVSSRLILAEAA